MLVVFNIFLSFQVARIKDLARKLADELPLATLSMKIKWFESLVSRHGVEPLKVEKKVDITKVRRERVYFPEISFLFSRSENVKHSGRLGRITKSRVT